MNALKKIGAAAIALTATAGAFAAGPDLTPLTNVVEFDTVKTAVLSVAGLLAVVYVAIKGAKIVLGMVRGA